MSRSAPLLLLLVACDPLAPSARGTISLDDSIDTTGLAWLNIVAHPDPDGTFGDGDLGPVGIADLPETTMASVPLDEVAFPYDYEVLNSVGVSDVPTWRVTAWLTDAWEVDRPAPGEPWGTTGFEAGKCSFGGYCDITDGVDLTIDALYE